MTINYDEFLSVEQKRTIVQQRLAQFAAEAYQHELNKKSLEGLEDTSGIENANKSLEILERAIAAHKAELEALPESE